MSDDINKSQFIATIPPIMTGIKTGGDGMRVQFDIPETDIGEAAKLLAMRGKLLRITVEVIQGLTNFDNETEKKPKGSAFKMGSGGIRIGRDR